MNAGADQVRGKTRAGDVDSSNISLTSIETAEGSPNSISTVTVPFVATDASMKGRRHIKTRSLEVEATPTYNLKKLMAQQLANRNAMHMVHQMKTVDSYDISRMKAYQVLPFKIIS